MKKYLIILSILVFSSCNDFLDVLPKGMVIPKSVEDYELILNNGGGSMTNAVYMSPEVYMPISFLSTSDYNYRTAYKWDEHQYLRNQTDGNWNGLYSRIYQLNEIINNIDKAESTTLNENLRKYVKGQALADRGKCYFALINLYSNHYTGKNRDDLGVPLLLVNDINAKSSRATLGAVHDRVISDLKASLENLPVSIDYRAKMRANKTTAYAFLSKVYLFKNDIDSAMYYISKCDLSKLTLYNYNDYLRPQEEIYDIFNKSTLPRWSHEDEEILWEGGITSNFWYLKICYSDELVKLFDKENDLRFYIWATKVDRAGNELPAYRYTAIRSRSFAATSPEMFLLRAECNARLGKIREAMQDINTLREHRYATGADYVLTAQTKEQAIQIVKEERLRELAFTGQYWLDLRRYHSYGESIPTYTRTLEDGSIATLAPDSKRYTCAIPRFVIDKNSNIQQNER